MPSNVRLRRKCRVMVTKKPSKRHRILYITLGIIIVLVTGLLIFLYWPASTIPELELNPINSQIYSTLVAIGIEDAVIEAGTDEIFIVYELPETIDKETSWYYIMGSVAENAPSTKIVRIQAYIKGEATEKITVNMEDIQKARSGTISEEEFKTKIEKT